MNTEEWIFGDRTLHELETNIGKGFRLCDFMLKPGRAEDVTESGGFLNNERIHVTPAGVVVRSKAELVIVTFLEMKGVDYVYERSMDLEYRTVAPDFTIVRPSDGRMIIWEHFGMMDNREYYGNTINKLYDYQSSGWLPYENFIATFSKKDSAMNMTVIETIYNTMLK